MVSTSSWEVPGEKAYLAISYDVQHIAVLGIVVTILGLKPLKNPVQPSLSLIMDAASNNPEPVMVSVNILLELPGSWAEPTISYSRINRCPPGLQ